MKFVFDWNRLSAEDRETGLRITDPLRKRWSNGGPEPDLVIAPDGNPYMYRWHIIRGDDANTYFHVQVADDPERPLHDHPWDNFSVILSGGYREVMSMEAAMPTERNTYTFNRKKGDVIYRHAAWPHRLFLPRVYPYTMTLFSTGPKVRDWGFWYETGWVPFEKVTKQLEDGRSVHIK